jgi:zinc and cadmium transporter
MTLAIIFLACLAAGNGSVWLARILMLGGSRLAPARVNSREAWLSASAGALLATALLHLLPEALESGETFRTVLATALGGVLFAFVLERAELWHHGHEHPGPSAVHGGRWPVLVADAMHGAGDGVVIAAAFLADLQVGALVSLAILVHEVPHHIGDLVTVGGRRPGAGAFLQVSVAGSLTVVGGVAGWAMAQQAHALLPYILSFAASSFIYVALADLIPQLRYKVSMGATLGQTAFLGGGIAAVAIVTGAIRIH